MTENPKDLEIYFFYLEAIPKLIFKTISGNDWEVRKLRAI
jgi:hypothetical protein